MWRTGQLRNFGTTGQSGFTTCMKSINFRHTYDLRGRLIEPSQYNVKLPGAIAMVMFKCVLHAIGDISSNLMFNPDQIDILAPPRSSSAVSSLRCKSSPASSPTSSKCNRFNWILLVFTSPCCSRFQLVFVSLYFNFEFKNVCCMVS